MTPPVTVPDVDWEALRVVLSWYPSWHRHALCAAQDEVDFFSTSPRVQQAAVAICQQCTVVAECGAYRATMPIAEQVYGVWAGTTPAQRKDARRAVA